MKRINWLQCLALLILLTSLSAFSFTYDRESPLGSSNANTIDTAIQETKKSHCERLDIDHQFPDTNAGMNASNCGYHRKVTMPTTDTVVAGIADVGIVYVDDYSGYAELYYMDEQTNAVLITKNGGLNNSFTSVTATTVAVTNLTVSTDLVVQDDLDVTGDSVLTGTLAVTGDVTMAGDLSIGDDISLSKINAASANAVLVAGSVNFNGDTFGIRQGYNVDTVIDQGTGDYRVIFSTPFADTNWRCVASSSTRSVEVDVLSTTGVSVKTYGSVGSANNAVEVHVIATGHR